MAPRVRADQDYYARLGLAPEATPEEVRKAYRRLALRWHPDRNPGDPEAEKRFKAISEAYAVLIDAARRAAYDRARAAGRPEDFRPSREDLFRDLFANPGASAIFEELARELERLGMRVDRHYFHRTLFGGRTVVTGGVFIITPFHVLPALLSLARVALKGFQALGAVGAPAARPLPPPPGVVGRVVRAGRWLLGLPPAREAAGQALADRDLVLPLRLTRTEAERGGRKRVVLPIDGQRDEVLVGIPAGVRAGTRLRLHGKGRPGPGGRRGDVYLAVEIEDEG